MKKSFEEPQMQIIIFGSRDTDIVTSDNLTGAAAISRAGISDGINGGDFSVSDQ